MNLSCSSRVGRVTTFLNAFPSFSHVVREEEVKKKMQHAGENCLRFRRPRIYSLRRADGFKCKSFPTHFYPFLYLVPRPKPSYLVTSIPAYDHATHPSYLSGDSRKVSHIRKCLHFKAHLNKAQIKSFACCNFFQSNRIRKWQCNVVALGFGKIVGSLSFILTL